MKERFVLGSIKSGFISTNGMRTKPLSVILGCGIMRFSVFIFSSLYNKMSRSTVRGPQCISLVRPSSASISLHFLIIHAGSMKSRAPPLYSKTHPDLHILLDLFHIQKILGALLHPSHLVINCTAC